MTKVLLDPENSTMIEINPMVIGLKNSYCKINSICCNIAIGGAILKQCNNFVSEDGNLFCSYSEVTDG